MCRKLIAFAYFVSPTFGTVLVNSPVNVWPAMEDAAAKQAHHVLACSDLGGRKKGNVVGTNHVAYFIVTISSRISFKTVKITGTEVGATATFSCKAGYVFLGNQSIEKKCQETGWSGGGFQICIGCPETVVSFRGTTYNFNCGDFTFDQAEAFCKNQGGNITTIETEEENSFLKHILTLIKSAGGALTNNWWIGFTDINTEGSFEWISGQPVTYTDWFQGPPPEPNGVAWNNAQADCVLMRQRYGFQWTDSDCRYIDVQAICELW